MIESNFYILERQPSDTILDTGRQHSEQTRGILRNSVKLVPDYPTPQGWQFSNFVSGSCRGCQETLAVPVCTQHCLYLLQWAASCAAPAQAVQTGREWGSVVSRCSEGADVSVTLPVLRWTDRLQVTQADQYKLLNRKCEISFQFCAHEHLRSFPI